MAFAQEVCINENNNKNTITRRLDMKLCNRVLVSNLKAQGIERGKFHFRLGCGMFNCSNSQSVC